MTFGSFGFRVVAFALTLSAVFTADKVSAGVPGGTPIVNTASATFQTSAGQDQSTVSNTVRTFVAQISAIAVSPKQPIPIVASDSFSAGLNFVRVFTITNDSNISDAYTLTSLTAGSATIISANIGSANGSVMTVGSTTTPTIAPGQTIQIYVTISSSGIVPGTVIPVNITARTTVTNTANGLQSDSGRLFGVAGQSAKLSGSDGGVIIYKTVQLNVSAASTPGGTVTYGITFKNTGGSPAINSVITDPLPNGVNYVQGSARVNGQDANTQVTYIGNLVMLHAGIIAPGSIVAFTFDVKVADNMKAGSTILNYGHVSADGLESKKTSAASLLIGVSNVVYDGYDGKKHPVGGAVLTVVDEKTGLPVPLTPQHPLPVQSFSKTFNILPQTTNLISTQGVNTANLNPFTTDVDGLYNFIFSTKQLGTVAAPAVYDILITAPTYLNRRIQLTVSPGSEAPLYNVQLVSLDSQPLAIEGTFTLATTVNPLSDTFGLIGNQPLFKPSPITIVKSVDRSSVSIGDRAVFTLEYGTENTIFNNVTITDTLPPGLAYGVGSARFDGLRLDPQVNGRMLTWKFPTLKGKHSIMYATVVTPGAPENTTLVNIVDIAASSPNTGGIFTSQARASVLLIPGFLSERIIITGRVYADTKNLGYVGHGDKGIPDIRIFLENGEYVVTDNKGRYSFPSVHPGMHALRLDESTIPVGYKIFGRSSNDDRSSERLVHGIMDTTLMQDVNFGLKS